METGGVPAAGWWELLQRPRRVSQSDRESRWAAGALGTAGRLGAKVTCSQPPSYAVLDLGWDPPHLRSHDSAVPHESCGHRAGSKSERQPAGPGVGGVGSQRGADTGEADKMPVNTRPVSEPQN